MSFLDLPVVSLLFKSKRSIQKISGYITISETTKDELEITQQPVQQGAVITDHAFIKPTLLTLQIQFDRTNTLAALASAAAGAAGTLIGGAVGGAVGGLAGGLLTGGFDNILAETYSKLLALQSSREPFSIATPKRVYDSMLFQSLGLLTDKATENVLSISATFQQIIIVKVTTALVSRSLQSNPGVTGATEVAGKKASVAVKIERALGI